MRNPHDQHTGQGQQPSDLGQPTGAVLHLAAILPAYKASQAPPASSCHASLVSQQQHMMVSGTLSQDTAKLGRELSKLHVPSSGRYTRQGLLRRMACSYLWRAPDDRRNVPWHLSCCISDNATHHPTLSLHALQTRTA